MREIKLGIALVAILLVGYTKSQAQTWIPLAAGMSYKEIMPSSTIKNKTKSQPIFILKVEKGNWEWDILTYRVTDKDQVATEWAEDYNLSVVFNAGMFSFKSPYPPTGFCKDGGVLVNDDKPRMYKSAFIWDNDEFPEDDINDLWPSIASFPTPNGTSGQFLGLGRYNNSTQLMRMIVDGKVVWGRNEKQYYSLVCVGTDSDQNIYIIHSRNGIMVNDHAREILRLIPEIDRLSYLEGGPEATLYVKVGDFEYLTVGSNETGYWEDDSNTEQYELPNVIGIKAKIP